MARARHRESEALRSRPRRRVSARPKRTRWLPRALSKSSCPPCISRGTEPRTETEDRNRGRQWPPAKGWRLAHRRIAGRRAARAGFASRSADARPEGKPIGRVRASPTLGMKGSLQSCRVSVPSGSTPWRPGSASRVPPSSSRRPPRCCCARATSRMPPRTAGWISTLPGSEPESGESRRRREALGGNRKTAVRAARRDPARDGSYRSCPSQGSSLAA